MSDIDKIIGELETAKAKADKKGSSLKHVGDYVDLLVTHVPALVAMAKRLRIELTHAKSDAERMRYELGIIAERLKDRIREAEFSFKEQHGFVRVPALEEVANDICQAIQELPPLDETHNPETCKVCQARQAYQRAAALDITKTVGGTLETCGACCAIAVETMADGSTICRKCHSRVLAPAKPNRGKSR